MLSIVFVKPEIPGNTGSVARTCLALNARLILIRPYGFDISEKACRRAGLDYFKHVALTEYDDWDSFIKGETPDQNSLFFFSKKATTSYFDARFHENSYLVFGSETKGLPPTLFKLYPERFFSIPMLSTKVRSLNLSNAATAVAYEALRQRGAMLLSPESGDKT